MFSFRAELGFIAHHVLKTSLSVLPRRIQSEVCIPNRKSLRHPDRHTTSRSAHLELGEAFEDRTQCCRHRSGRLCPRRHAARIRTTKRLVRGSMFGVLKVTQRNHGSQNGVCNREQRMEGLCEFFFEILKRCFGILWEAHQRWVCLLWKNSAHRNELRVQ